MSEGYLIGLDLGTTNIKGILMTADGRTTAEFSSAVEYNRGSDGSVEYDAEAFFNQTAGVIRKLVDEAQDRIIGLSIVSASGNTVLLDGEMKPLRPAINWMDCRFDNEAEKVLGDPYDYYEITGWPFGGSFPLAHLSWLKLNEPDIYQKAEKICMMTDYVNFRLTGRLAINPSTATTSYMQDQVNVCWSRKILVKFGIKESMLPEIIKSGHLIGKLTKEASAASGLETGVPIIAGSFDHPGAARGTGIIDEGDLLLSCGTSWVGFYPCKDRNKLITLNMLIDPFLENCFAGMFSLPRIGSNIDILIKKWVSADEDRYRLFNEYAKAAVPGDLTVNPMTDIERDLSIYGKEEISHAIMTGTAVLMSDKIKYFAKSGLSVNRMIMAGGPTKSKIWLKILDEVLGVGIKVAGSHAGARGAAILAGIGTGLYKDEFDARNKGVCNGTF